MDDKVQKISRIIIQPVRNLFLKMHVKLVHETKYGKNSNFHNIFTMDGKEYLNLDLQSFLTLEIKDGEWTPSKSILINEKNIYHITKGLEKCIDIIYNDDIFALNENHETIMYKEGREKGTVRIYNLGMNQRLVIQPAVVYEDDISYEGVVFFINKTDNYIQLPIDALEALYHALKQVNIFVYSQMLLNYYVTTMGIKPSEKQEVGKLSFKPNVLTTDAAKEVTKSTLKKKSDKEFFGFDK